MNTSVSFKCYSRIWLDKIHHINNKSTHSLLQFLLLMFTWSWSGRSVHCPAVWGVNAVGAGQSFITFLLSSVLSHSVQHRKLCMKSPILTVGVFVCILNIGNQIFTPRVIMLVHFQYIICCMKAERVDECCCAENKVLKYKYLVFYSHLGCFLLSGEDYYGVDSNSDVEWNVVM